MDTPDVRYVEMQNGQRSQDRVDAAFVVLFDQVIGEDGTSLSWLTRDK